MNKVNVADRLMRFESETDYMYQGAGGEVVVGIGHVIPSAQAALSVRWHGSPSNEIILRDWKRVWAAMKGLPQGRYAQLTTIRLDSAAVYDMLETDIGRHTASTAIAVPEFTSYADPVQEAILDLAWTLGIAGLLKHKEKLLAACRAGDWLTAALESRRDLPDEMRNAEICVLFANAGHAPSKGLGAVPRTKA